MASALIWRQSGVEEAMVRSEAAHKSDAEYHDRYHVPDELYVRFYGRLLQSGLRHCTEPYHVQPHPG